MSSSIWYDNLGICSLYSELLVVSVYWCYHVRGRLDKNSKKIEFFDLDDSNKTLFKCDDKGIYLVNKLNKKNLELFKQSREILEWFEYLKDNLEF